MNNDEKRRRCKKAAESMEIFDVNNELRLICKVYGRNIRFCSDCAFSLVCRKE